MASGISSVRLLTKYAAEKYGDKIFCRYRRDGRIHEKSYSRFYEDCLAVCRYIRSVDSRRLHIAFIGKTSYEYIACLTGMIFSGSTVVPFAPDISVSEACVLFDDADIKMLFCEEEFSEKAKKICESCPGVEQIVSLGNYSRFESIFEKYGPLSPYAALSDIDEAPDECALIVYTSGTTGVRKGVMLSNRNIASNTCYDEYNMDDDDVCLSILPMHHVFCYCCDVLKTVYDGGTLCINGTLADMYKNLLVFEPTIMRIVPSICRSILTRIKITERDNPELSPREAAERVCGKRFRRMIAGSAFLSGAVIDEFEKYGISARQGYGMSECSPRISTSDFSDVCKYSNGKLLSVDEVRTVDGEIQVRGPSVMLGYYKRSEETAQAFTEDGFFRTGDLGYLDGDHIYLVGRKKNLIVLSNGENISPEEIENRFADFDLVKEVVVYAENDRITAEILPDTEFSQSLSPSFVASKIEEAVDRVNLVSPGDEQISSVKIRTVPFARTATGKIKRTEFHFGKEVKV